MSCFVLWFDIQTTYDVVRQFRSVSYPSVPGTITVSELDAFRKPKGGGQAYAFRVRYTYEVGGQKLEGSRVRYVTGRSREHAPAKALSKRFPLNAQVPVYYDADDPKDALLDPGGNGPDLLYPMYPGLFTILTLIGWCLAAMMRREPTDIPEFERNGRIHLTVFALPPSLIGVFGAGIAVFVGMGFWFSDSVFPISTAITIWASVFLAGGAAALVQKLRLRSGVYDVILDDQTVSLPATHGRRRRVQVPRQQIVTVSLDRQGQQKKAYRPTLEFLHPGGGSRLEPIGPWMTDQDKAQALADALKIRLRLMERQAKAAAPARSAR